MSTVKETNEILAEQNLQIKLPYPETWIVKHIDILEKKDLPGAVHVLLGLKMINDEGKEVSDLHFAQSEVKREPIYKSPQRQIKKDILPRRRTPDFENEKEAFDYLKVSIESLLKENGYAFTKSNTDLYGEKLERGFFINISPRSDDETLRKANALIELREKYGDANDYGLIILAFQESLGISRMDQDEWMSIHTAHLSKNHIGIFAVDNKDPNSIYPFTVYPREKDLRRYFIKTSTQWSLLRSRYTTYRPGVTNIPVL